MTGGGTQILTPGRVRLEEALGIVTRDLCLPRRAVAGRLRNPTA